MWGKDTLSVTEESGREVITSRGFLWAYSTGIIAVRKEDILPIGSQQPKCQL
jgi:hypothetical protein